MMTVAGLRNSPSLVVDGCTKAGELVGQTCNDEIILIHELKICTENSCFC